MSAPAEKPDAERPAGGGGVEGAPDAAGEVPGGDTGAHGGLFALPGWIVAWFYPHVALFVLANASAIALNAAMGRPWWALWVAVGSLALLGLHYLLYKIMTIDEAWVDARAEEVHLKSYDRGHIQEMSERRGLTTPADRIRKRRSRKDGHDTS
jgi:hypothetical protein